MAHFSPAWKDGNAINNRGITVEGADMGNDEFSIGLSIWGSCWMSREDIPNATENSVQESRQRWQVELRHSGITQLYPQELMCSPREEESKSAKDTDLGGRCISKVMLGSCQLHARINTFCWAVTHPPPRLDRLSHKWRHTALSL